MSQRNGQRAAERRGVIPPAPSLSAPVLATLTADELAAFKARQDAMIETKQAAADAELELTHFAMKLRQRHQWGPATVQIDLTTGEVTAAQG